MTTYPGSFHQPDHDELVDTAINASDMLVFASDMIGDQRAELQLSERGAQGLAQLLHVCASTLRHAAESEGRQGDIDEARRQLERDDGERAAR